MKQFIVPEMTFKGHSRSSAVLDRLDFLSETIKVDYTIFLHQKNSWNDLEGWSRSLAMSQFCNYISLFFC